MRIVIVTASEMSISLINNLSCFGLEIVVLLLDQLRMMGISMKIEFEGGECPVFLFFRRYAFAQH